MGDDEGGELCSICSNSLAAWYGSKVFGISDRSWTDSGVSQGFEGNWLGFSFGKVMEANSGLVYSNVSGKYNFLLIRVIKSVYLGFSIVSKEDAPHGFGIKFFSIGFWNMDKCYTAKNFEVSHSWSLT